jgi:Holliday junction DNA helicase RuvA
MESDTAHIKSVFNFVLGKEQHMIRYIKGTLAYVEENAIVVENQGIGYRILVSGALLGHLPSPGSPVTIYTYLNVREDALQLYGFESMDDLEVFQQLITVSGIGPKGGLSILSVLTADDIRFAVMADDAKTIAKAPGIGAKTARKLIVELKDKLSIKEVIETALEHGESAAQNSSATQSKSVAETVEALVALGYSATDAMKAVRQVENAGEVETEELLKQVLKHM